ncbi:hypothetical protein ACIF8T_22635 [Streptomyces sp. NPDC085946]|uniref:hypothetical protein n=1 Tax=Streptomyces sp. NPDC085946 TaxID=3365744 RepID=UPI0037D97CC8
MGRRVDVPGLRPHVFVCGGDLPADLRARMPADLRARMPADLRDRIPAALRARMPAEHGPTTPRNTAPGGDVVVMRVLRAEFGVDLTEAGAVLRRVSDGRHTGTPPERELPPRGLRGAGVDAVATR